jgi:hypothetical protein
MHSSIEPWQVGVVVGATHLRWCSPVAPLVAGKMDMETMNKYKGSRRKEALDIVLRGGS